MKQQLLHTTGQKIVLFLITGAGAGYFPLAPGTCGTFVAIPLSLGLNRIATFSVALALATLVVFIVCAIWLSTKGSEILGQKDPGVIVIDEIAGFLVANFMSPPKLLPLVLGFLLFRFFDIAKIFPAAWLAKLPAGKGIVLDDVMAGLYTFLILRFISLLGLS